MIGTAITRDKCSSLVKFVLLSLHHGFVLRGGSRVESMYFFVTGSCITIMYLDILIRWTGFWFYEAGSRVFYSKRNSSVWRMDTLESISNRNWIFPLAKFEHFQVSTCARKNILLTVICSENGFKFWICVSIENPFYIYLCPSHHCIFDILKLVLENRHIARWHP